MLFVQLSSQSTPVSVFTAGVEKGTFVERFFAVHSTRVRAGKLFSSTSLSSWILTSIRAIKAVRSIRRSSSVEVSVLVRSITLDPTIGIPPEGKPSETFSGA